MTTACGVTTTIKTAPFRGQTLFFRCDREVGHEGQHHGTQKDQSEMFWGGEAARPSGDEALRAAALDIAGRAEGRTDDVPLGVVQSWAGTLRAALATPSSAPDLVDFTDPRHTGKHHDLEPVDPNFPDATLVTKIEGEFH